MYEGSRLKVEVDPRPTSRLSATRLRTCLYFIYASKIYVRLHARENYASTLHAGAKRKAWKKIQACIGFKLLTYAIPVHRSNQPSKQAIWELVIIKMGHSLGSNLSQK